MLSKDQIARKILKLRALAERPGSVAEGEAARKAIATLMRDYGITADDLRLRAGVDEATTGPERAAPFRPDINRPVAREVVIADHREHPDRVHLAYDHMSSVCGVRPTFVWVHEREKLLTFDDPCPHCLASGILDTRHARKRLQSAP